MAPLLLLDAVTKRYWRGDNRLLVLDEVSLEVEPGDFVKIRGRRSSGKTTLLRVAAGVEEPDAGRVLFEGLDVNRLSGGRRADLLSQDIAIAQRQGPASPLEMLDYVALPLLSTTSRADAHRRAEAALHKVGVAECAGQTWEMLSDGSRALVSMAHALVRGPKLLLADDPAAGLDAVETAQVLTLLAEVAREAGVGVIMVSPEITDLRPAGRLMSLSDGRLIGPDRNPAEVIRLHPRHPQASGR